MKAVLVSLDDSTMDRIIDDLVVRAGGQRGFTYDGLKIARWDLKAVLKDHGTPAPSANLPRF